MWEAIRDNRRRSWILVSAMGAILLLLGFLIGFAVHPRGGTWGVLGALALWLGLWGAALLQGDDLFLGTAGAVRIEREDVPQLVNVVEEMTIASGLGKKPEVYLIPDPSPNAFAVGLRRDRAAVAVTSGLLKLLNRDELQGVVAHEIGHLRNRDTAFMVLAGVMLGAIVLLADLVRRWLFYGGRGSRRGLGRVGGGQGAVVVLLVGLVVVLLAPLLARLLYFACSRRREYLADASAAQFTRYPEGLASALEKIAVRARGGGEVNRVLAPMYIVNPMTALVGLFSTHPPTEERIRILRSMGGGAGYPDYEAAYRKITRDPRGCLGRGTLAHAGPVAARGPSAEPETRADAVGRAREVVELLGRLDGLVRIVCACGMGIGVPAGFQREAVPCPRCGRLNPVPRAEPAGSAGDAPAEAPAPMRYRRKGKGWESFQCGCGRAIQLSPSFIAPFVTCDFCGRRIGIEA